MEDEDILTPEPLYKRMVQASPAFSCGESEFGRDAADWICGNGYPTVKNELNRGTRVWLYRNRANDYVGFGSLGEQRWLFGQSAQTIQLIPYVAVFAVYQGKPMTGLKYCYQIIDHVLDEAVKRASSFPLVGLSVHPDNHEAIYIYTKYGFVWVKNDRGLSRMLLSLR